MEVGLDGGGDVLEYVPLLLPAGFDGRQQRLHEAAAGGALRPEAQFPPDDGVPQAIRSDNGPEFVSQAIQGWLGKLNIRTLYVAPGSPWENGYAESFHSKLRDEFLAQEEFETLASARRQTRNWQDDYNHHRPHSSLGYVTPVEFAARCAASATELLPAAPPATPPLQPHNGLTQPVLS